MSKTKFTISCSLVSPDIGKDNKVTTISNVKCAAETNYKGAQFFLNCPGLQPATGRASLNGTILSAKSAYSKSHPLS